MKYLILAALVFGSLSVRAEELPDPKHASYLCSASYIVRGVKHLQGKHSGKITELVTTVVSSISTDFGKSVGGGGGDIMGGSIVLDNGVVYSVPSKLTDPHGHQLQPIGSFDNGYATVKKDKISYEFEVQFFHDDPKGKAVGPEFHLIGEGSQIAEVKKNEFIQVSCNFVRRLNFRD